MKTFIQKGDVVTAVALADVTSGMITKVGSLVGVPATDALTGEEFELKLTGVYSAPKTVADAPAQFAKAYLKADGTEITTTASGNTLVGVFVEAAVNGDTECVVRLNGVGV